MNPHPLAAKVLAFLFWMAMGIAGFWFASISHGFQATILGVTAYIELFFGFWSLFDAWALFRDGVK